VKYTPTPVTIGIATAVRTPIVLISYAFLLRLVRLASTGLSAVGIGSRPQLDRDVSPVALIRVDGT